MSQGADGDTTLRSFSARRFDVRCEGGVTAQMKRVVGRGEVPVGSHGGFRFVDDNGAAVLRIAGALGAGPAGKFRFSGLVDTGEDGRLECDSGRIFWTAR